MIETVLQNEIDTWARIGHPALMQKFVAERGRKFESVKLAKKLGKPKLCYMNAYKYAVKHDLEYVEGFLMLPNIPFLIQHAWCTEKGSDVVIETTIKNVEGHEYYGIEFDIFTVEQEMMRNRVYGLLDTGCGINIDLMKRMGFDCGF